MTRRRAAIAIAAACATLIAAVGFRSPTGPEPPVTAHLAIGASARVGTFVYRLDDVRCARDEHRLRVSITLFRADATQTFGAADVARIRLRDGDDRYAPLEVEPIACDGANDCAVLDPGNSRIDALSFVLPERAPASLRFEVAARPDEAGPRFASWSLRCDVINAASLESRR